MSISPEKNPTLEKRVQFLNIITSVLIVLVLYLFLFGSPLVSSGNVGSISSKIQVQELSLVDSDGATHAKFYLNKDVGAILEFFDNNKNSIMELSTSSSGSQLELTNDMGQSVRLRAYDPQIIISNGGKFDAAEYGGHGFSLFDDETGKFNLTAHNPYYGSPEIRLVDRNSTRILLSAGTDEGAKIKINDSNGKSRLTLGSVDLVNKNGVQSTYPESTVTFFNDKENVTFQLPLTP